MFTGSETGWIQWARVVQDPDTTSLALCKLAMVYKELYFSVLPAVLSEALLQEQPRHH